MSASNIPVATASIWQRSQPATAPSAQTPASAAVTPSHSPLVAALEARKRATVPYPAESFAPGIAGNVKVRIPTAGELGTALKCAHAFIDKETENSPNAAKDPNYTANIFNTFAIHVSLRDEHDPDGLPAFGSPQWMLEYFTPQQISVMLNMHNNVVGEKEPVEWVLDEERLSALMLVCARNAGSDIPDKALIRFSRETMAEAFIRASVMYGDAMAEIEALKAQIAELTGTAAEPAPEEPTQDQE